MGRTFFFPRPDCYDWLFLQPTASTSKGSALHLYGDVLAPWACLFCPLQSKRIHETSHGHFFFFYTVIFHQAQPRQPHRGAAVLSGCWVSLQRQKKNQKLQPSLVGAKCLSHSPYFTHSFPDHVTRSVTSVLRGVLCPTDDRSPF